MTDTPHTPIVIIGAGLAGWAMVDALAKANLVITLISADNADRYHKPMLSSGFAQAKSPDSLVRTTGVDSAKTININLLTHSTVSEIDSQAKTLIYKKNNQNHKLSFDYLIFATGAVATYPQGVDRTLAVDLNHLDGYRQIFKLIEHKKDSQQSCHIAVIGAGMVGVEIAEDLAKAQVAVSLIDAYDYPLSSLLPPIAGRRFIDALTKMGVTYLNTVRPISTTQDGDRITLSLDNGQVLWCDGIIVATGLKFDTHLAQSANLEHTAAGFVVDQYLQTSTQGIFALGDCAVIDGTPCRFVAPHRIQASTIASVILGTPTPYKHTTPMIRLKNKSLSIQATGDAFAKIDWQMLSDSEGKLVMQKTHEGVPIATLTVTTPQNTA